MSTLLTLNEQVELLPLASVAMSVIDVTPTPDTIVPAAGDCVTVTDEQKSATVANDV